MWDITSKIKIYLIIKFKIMKVLWILIAFYLFYWNYVYSQWSNYISSVTFNWPNLFSYMLWSSSELIPLYIEPHNLENYNIKILEWSDILEVIKTIWFNDVLILKRIIDENKVWYHNISIKVTTEDNKSTYIYDKWLISIEKPVLLVWWILWPDWWTINNNWNDISISVWKWELSEEYNIKYLSIENTYKIFTIPKMSNEDISKLNIKEPSSEIIYKKYIWGGELPNYYTFPSIIEEPNFRDIINNTVDFVKRDKYIKVEIEKIIKNFNQVYKKFSSKKTYDLTKFSKVELIFIEKNIKIIKKSIIELETQLSESEKYRYHSLKNLSLRIEKIEKNIIKNKNKEVLDRDFKKIDLMLEKFFINKSNKDWNDYFTIYNNLLVNLKQLKKKYIKWTNKYNWWINLLIIEYMYEKIHMKQMDIISWR